MEKLKKVMLVLVTFVLYIILNANIQSQASSSNLYLNELNFEAKIQTNGDMEIIETWDISISDTNTLFKTFKTDTSKYSNIKNVEVIDITNGIKPFNQINEYMYHVTPNCYYGMINDDGNFEIAWGVGLDNKSATKKYQISYTVDDAISKYSDYAELYWQFVGEDFEVDAKKITGTITLPSNSTSKDEIKVWGHTEDLNGEIYATDLNKIEFTLNNFRAGRFVEIRTLFPTDMIYYSAKTQERTVLEEVISEETKWANDANFKRKVNRIVPLIIVTIIDVILIILTLKFINNLIKKIKEIKILKKYQKSENIIYFREIPREDATPAEALYVFKNLKSELQSTDMGKIFSATLLDLSLKKMVDFRVEKAQWGKDEVYIKLLNKEAILTLKSPDEKIIGEFLIKAIERQKSEEITVKELEKYIQTHSTEIIKLKGNIEKATKKELENKEITDEKEAKKYEKISNSIGGYLVGVIFTLTFIAPLCISMSTLALIGIVPFTLVCIANMISISIELKRINVYTQKGVDESEKWKGLKKYMEEFSMLNEREVPEIVIWEKFLIYATVFGIADKVLKQLKIVYPDIEDMINTGNYTYMYLMVHTNFSNSFSNSISNSMSTTYSSASGGGGGFSGGGGGGRRSEVVEAEDNTYFLKNIKIYNKPPVLNEK